MERAVSLLDALIWLETWHWVSIKLNRIGDRSSRRDHVDKSATKTISQQETTIFQEMSIKLSH